MAGEGRLTIVGLGSGDQDDLTLGTWHILQKADKLYLRTAQHPVVDWLRQQEVTFTTFDALYEQYDHFSAVYEVIVERLIAAASAGTSIVYAVPGHPMVAEQTTHMLLQRGEQAGVDVEVVGGRSFLEQAFTSLRIDPIDGFLLLNGLSLTPESLNPRTPTVIAQVYDQLTASDVKLTLMERYPDDYEVTVAHALGINEQEHVHRVPLYELDHNFPLSSLSLVFVPPVPREVYLTREFTDFIHIIATLRGPEGCPWDRQQTHDSLRKYLVEETAEFIEAVNEGDPEHMCDELGDVLLQIALHAQIAAEQETFSIHDVIAGISEKMLRRHPHVFADGNAANADEVVSSWQAIKDEERRVSGKAETTTIRAGIPAELPILSRVDKIQKRAAEVGFDWEAIDPVADKVREELAECMKAGPEEVELELGDLLFAVVNVARWLKVDPEQALRKAEMKFARRFDALKNRAETAGKTLRGLTPEQMDQLWQAVKREEKRYF